MTKQRGSWLPKRGVQASIIAVAMTGLSASVIAADDEAIEEMVVTGSYISGTPEDAALPVEVLTRADMQAVGDPSINEMIRNLNVSSGALAETNQFDTRGGQGNEGVSTVNLRGLGAARTLVLLNSKRHVATENLGVDISAIPSIAIRRLEVLKDGAAATYGSDAIGGVVNFITRSDFEGFEIGGSFQDIDGSDGDTEISAIWGGSAGDLSWALSAEYGERSELRIRDRDWALRTYAENPAPGGWSSIGNPGTLLPAMANPDGTPASPPFAMGLLPDPNCEAVGNTSAGGFCRFQYTFFDNLIEEEENTKVFGEVNYDINDRVSFHAEVLWAEMDIPAWKTSPAYPPQALTGADRFVAPTHPGLMALKAANPGLIADELGVYSWSRMLGVSGRNGEPEAAKRETETQRISAGFKGSFENGVGFDVSLGWSSRERLVTGSDMYIERMAFAMDGLGGAGCDPATGTPGAGGCEYYNPFSNALPFSAVTGANPAYDPSVANSDALINWMTATTGSISTNEQLVFDAIFNGEMGVELGGGAIGWAAGVQVRQDEYDFEVYDVANRAINPCPFNNPMSVTLGHVATLDCGAGGAGQLAFLAATDEESTDREIYAIFSEFNLPLSDSLEMQVAFRYEDYGKNDGGSSFDPKIAVRWDATEMLTFRGSASTTFRGPPSSALSGTSTALGFITPALAFKAVDTTGNPDLDPEEATAINFGAIFQTGNVYASVDYWSFDFSDPLQLESANQIVNAYGNAGCEDGGAGVGSASCDILRSRLTPEGTSIGGVQRISRFVINGSDIETSGIDYVAKYTFDDLGGGSLDLGVEGTYTLEYKSDDFISGEGILLASGGDFVGLSNEGTPFTPIPEYKNNFFVRWGNEQHRLGYTGRWVSGYDDEASDTPAALRKVDDYLTHDVTYVNNMVDNLTVSLSIFNISDEDPPQVANDLNYDAYNHNPFGRMIKLGVSYTFGAQ